MTTRTVLDAGRFSADWFGPALLAPGVLVIVTSIFVFGCTDTERQARYASFRARFADVNESVAASEMIHRVGEPDLRRAVVAGGPCSEVSGATEVLTYELRHPRRATSSSQYSVEMAFHACLDSGQKVIGKSFVEF